MRTSSRVRASLLGSLHVLATGPVEDLSINLYNGEGGRIHIDFEANPRLYTETEVAARLRAAS